MLHMRVSRRPKSKIRTAVAEISNAWRMRLSWRSTHGTNGRNGARLLTAAAVGSIRRRGGQTTSLAFTENEKTLPAHTGRASRITTIAKP
jgi:hypothetical protein